MRRMERLVSKWAGIEIGVIRELAISAAVGVAVIIFTKMFLLPILMSYSDVTEAGLRKVAKQEASAHKVPHFLSRLTEKKVAFGVSAMAAAILVGGLYASKDIKIGDFHQFGCVWCDGGNPPRRMRRIPSGLYS